MDRVALHALIEETLVWKLYRDGCWGAGHHSETNLFRKGFPSHLGTREIERVADDLRQRGILAKRASGHEYQWFLKPEKKVEIEAIVARREKRLGL